MVSCGNRSHTTIDVCRTYREKINFYLFRFLHPTIDKEIFDNQKKYG